MNKLSNTILALLLAAALGALPVSAQDAEAAPAEAPPAEAAPPPEPVNPADQSIQQVQIQVWISQTDEQGLRIIGNNINYTRFVRDAEESGSVERVVTNVFDPASDTFRTTLPAPDAGPYSDNVRLTPDSVTPWTPGGNTLVPAGPGESQINSRSGAGLTYDIIDTGRGTIEGAFRSIETKSDSDLISKPSLLVIDGKEAEIRAGEEIPYQAVEYKNGLPQLNIAWREIGVNMILQPTVQPDDLIMIDLKQLEVSDRLPETPIAGLEVPVFSNRSQSGSVLVPDSQTLVIGGLASRVVRKGEKRVPIVGRIPVLGIPFRGRDTQATNTHLLIFIQPTRVDLRSMEPQMESAMNFWNDRQWRNVDSIQQEVDLMYEEQ